jgi:fructose-bisphosphate aldolase/2-amino-3,7-dideoxy-D-threo-hept-6-ulosonate synthase
MIYPCGPLIENPFDLDLIKHSARVGAELGADIVITSVTCNIESFHEVVKGCPVPILASDGPKMNLDLEILKFVNDSILAGAAGVSIGINVFQHKKVFGITKAISKILFEKAEVEKVYQELMEDKI